MRNFLVSLKSQILRALIATTRMPIIIDGILPPIGDYYTIFMDFFKNHSKKRIYLDYVSSTPIDHDMVRSFPLLAPGAVAANPSALHKEGQIAKKILLAARQLAAKTLGAHEDEIIFTSNATESDNIALQGSVRAFLKQGLAPEQIAVVTTDLEHAAVLETVQFLNEQVMTVVIPTENGVADAKAITVPEDAKAVIVSVMYVNNEIGTIQDVSGIAKRIRFLKKNIPDIAIVLHVDATQAPLTQVLNVEKLGIDMMTLGATKLYCPKGVGLLYVRRHTALSPIMFGGGQEFGIRPGTPAIQLIRDFAHALQYAQQHIESFSEKTKVLQTQFELLITKEIPEAVITAYEQERVPHLSHIALEKIDSELLVLELDARNIAVSAKSACKNDQMSGQANESDIVERIHGKGWGAIRFSFGRMTTISEIRKAVTALRAVLEKYRS